jgi:hypothetical protein
MPDAWWQWAIFLPALAAEIRIAWGVADWLLPRLIAWLGGVE